MELLEKLLEVKAKLMSTEEIFKEIVDECSSYLKKGCPENDIDKIHDLFTVLGTGLTKLAMLRENLERNEVIENTVSAIKKDLIEMTKLLEAKESGQEYDIDRLSELQEKLAGMPDVNIKVMKVNKHTKETSGWTDVKGNPTNGPSLSELKEDYEELGILDEAHSNDNVEFDENGFCNDPDCMSCQAGKDLAKSMKDISKGFPMGKGGDA